MELILVCTVVGVICLAFGLFAGAHYGSTKVMAVLAQAKAGLTTEEQALIAAWRTALGKATSASAGGTAAPAAATTTGTGAPPASASLPTG